MRVDAHYHQWDLAVHDQPWLAGIAMLERSFLLPELQPLWRAHEFDGGVLVQCLPEQDETAWLLRLAAGEPDILGVVGWADLTAADLPGRLAALRNGPGGDRLIGLRHLVQSEDDPDWLARADVRRGLRTVAAAELIFDLLVRAEQLPAAAELTRAMPELTFVLDHAGNPPTSAAANQAWAANLAMLARQSNVAVKLSGLVTRFGSAPWSIQRLRPWAETVLDAFGPGRVMFGSDWPVCLLAAEYAEVLTAAEALVDGLSGHEQMQVFGGTATQWYRLPLDDSPTPATR